LAGCWGSWRRMEFESLASVYVGDMVPCTVTMAEKDDARRLIHGTASYVNQEGREILRARFSGFPSLVRLAR
jgi:hypothetical protein